MKQRAEGKFKREKGEKSTFDFDSERKKGQDSRASFLWIGRPVPRESAAEQKETNLMNTGGKVSTTFPRLLLRVGSFSFENTSFTMIVSNFFFREKHSKVKVMSRWMNLWLKFTIEFVEWSWNWTLKGVTWIIRYSIVYQRISSKQKPIDSSLNSLSNFFCH